MRRFRHMVTDGLVGILDGTPTESIYPFSWWILEVPDYSYPEGATYIQYVEGGTSGQNYYVKDNSQHPLPEDPWLAGNTYIANKLVYDSDYDEYINTPKTLSEAKNIKWNELFSQFDTVRSGGIVYLTNTFPSDMVTMARLRQELNYCIALETTPIGYYVKDILNAHINLNLPGLTTVVVRIEELHYLCRVNYDYHYEAVDNLTTIEDVMAYDVTTGWPAIPYSP